MRYGAVMVVAVLAVLLPEAASRGGEAASRPGANGIAGMIKATGKVVRVVAVDRAWADVLKVSQAEPRDPFVYEGVVDASSGAFHIEKLLPGRAYDLIVWTEDGQGRTIRWEGASLEYHRPIIPSTAATAEDRKAIEALITEPPEFYDKVRVLRMAADHQHAAVLVELKRTRDFHSDRGGEVIYRVEIWYFENLFGGWAKDANTEKVVARVRGAPSALAQNWQFMAELGGIVPSDEAVKVVLPAEAEEKRGIAGGVK